MSETRVADNVAWYLHQELKRAKKQPKVSRIDARFNDWAKREGINLKQMDLMKNTHNKKGT